MGLQQQLLFVLWHIYIDISSIYGNTLIINTNGTATDLICRNTSSFDSCIINCGHLSGAQQRKIDCMDASICILNISEKACASTTTIDARNAHRFEIYVSADDALSSSNIYLPSNNNGSAYIYAYKGHKRLYNANIYGNNTQNIIINCSDFAQLNANTYNGDCSNIAVYASNSYNLEIIVNQWTTMDNPLIYCPQNGLCLIDISQLNSRMFNGAIYSLQGINNYYNNSNKLGLKLICIGGGNTCEGSIVRCDIHYSTYGVIEFVNPDWELGECADINRVVNSNYDPDWYYVSSLRSISSQLVCPENVTSQGFKGCIIQCVHSNLYMGLHCSDGICIVEIVNGCGGRAFVYSKNAVNLTVNVLEPDGTFWLGRVDITDPDITRTVIFHCFAFCGQTSPIFYERGDRYITYSSIDYVEVNVYDGGSFANSFIRCPESSSIHPSCVLNCKSYNTQCQTVSYYSLNGIPDDLSISCNDTNTDHCTSLSHIYCGPYANITASVEYNATLKQWYYGECYETVSTDTPTTLAPTSAPSINITADLVSTTLKTTQSTETTLLYTTTTSFIYTDFEYKIKNVSPKTFVNINKSIDEMEIIVDDLYDNNTDIKHSDIHIINGNKLMYINQTVIIIVRVKHIEIYEYIIINYTESIKYLTEFEEKTREQFNDSIIDVVKIIRYINITNIATTTTPPMTEFDIDYTEELFILIFIINGITIFLAIIVFIQTKICKWKTDSAKPFILIMFGLRFTDIITDINVCYVLWIDYLEHKNDDMLLLIISVLSLIFLFVPWFVNIYSISIIRRKLANNRRTSLWFSRYNNSTFFLILVILTGDTFFSLQIISSYIFGIKRLDAGISEKLDIDQFRKIKVFGVVCLENFPQLILAAIYAFKIEKNNDGVISIAVLSMVISIISIFICVTSWCLMQISSKQQSHKMIKYAINMKLTANSINKDNEKRKIMKSIGYKQKLRNNLSLTIGVETDQIEIVYTSINNDGASVDVVHFIHNTEIQMNTSNNTDVERFILSKYNSNEQQTNVVLQKHFNLDYGVMHEILFNNNNDSNQSKQMEENEMVNMSLNNKQKTNTDNAVETVDSD